MKKIKIVGVRDSNYKTLLENLSLALNDIPYGFELEEINEIDTILKYHIHSIPALVYDDEVILQQNNHAPDVKEIRKLILEKMNKPIEIKNILVPVDFSEVSRNAFLYALDLAEFLNAQLKVVHFIHPQIETSDPAVINSIDTIVEARKATLDDFCDGAAATDMNRLVAKELIGREVQIGFSSDGLVSWSKRKNVDLIVMGTTGKGDAIKRFFGGVAVSVAQKAHCPVWLVPNACQFDGLKNIAYASNYESADYRMLHQIFELASCFEAKVQLVHINRAGQKSDSELEALILDRIFRARLEDTGHQLKVENVDSEHVWEGLYQYANQHASDLLVMVTKHRSFLENIWHKSQTAKMIRHSPTPVLVFHIDD